MVFEVEMTPSFMKDLDAILDYMTGTLKNPGAAGRLLAQTEKITAGLRSHPFLWPQYHAAELQMYRYAVLGHYLLFYRVDEAARWVYVMRLLYGGQNIAEV